MRSVLTLGGISVVVLTLASLATTSVVAKQPSAEEQVAVLLKWYHDYYENGKYKQAVEIAETAHALAPDDPRTIAAVTVARRQQTDAQNNGNAEQKLDRVLTKIDQLEQQLKELAAQKQRLEKKVQALQSRNEQLTRGTRSPYREPRGSPDRID